MYLPLAEMEISAWVLFIIGFSVGVLGGFFGIGGGFMVTPALNIFGFPMAYAVGTDLTQIMGKSIIATVKHRKMGNVDLRLGVLMFLGTAVGVELGKEFVLYLEEIGRVDMVVRAIYILLLGGTGSYMLFDYWKFKKEEGEKVITERLGTSLSQAIQRINLPPRIALPHSQISAISVWAILLIGLLTGFLAGFLGVGGGFIRMPSLVYAIGVPTTIAVGTDLFEIIFSSAIGAFLYAIEGRVEVVAAMIMVSGGAVGAQIGTLGTKYVKGMSIRFYFALTILLAGVSVVMKQLGSMYQNETLNSLSGYLILTVAGLMTLYITVTTVKGAMEERATFPGRRARPRFLFATGGSEHSLLALRLGAKLSKFYGAENTVLTVTAEEDLSLERVQSRAREIMSEEGVGATYTTAEGEPSKEILKTSQDFDLLMIGSHGTGSITEELLGDNATRIAENMKTSTLVAKRKPHVNRVLAAVNLPDYRENVVYRSIEAARAFNAPLEFLYISPSPLMYPIRKLHLEVGELMEVCPEETQAVEELLELAAQRGVEANVNFRNGIPEEEILLEAREKGFDLIVLGDSGWRGILGRLMGSLSAHITKNSRASVLVVHEKMLVELKPPK